MTKRIVYTSAPTLGPFLTLILLRSHRKARATAGSASEVAEVAGCSATGDETCDVAAYTGLIEDESARTEAPFIPANRMPLGPFLTLILTSRCRRRENERAWTACSLRSTLSRGGVKPSSPARSATETATSECRTSVRDTRR